MQALLPAEQEEVDNANQGPLEDHHRISKSCNNAINLYTYILKDPNNPAKMVACHSILSSHINCTLEFYPFVEGSSPKTSSRRWV